MNLHLNVNSAINKDDKLFKVRPYIELLNKKFQQFGVHKTNLLIDEHMIAYQGRHSARMCCKNKPIRFGYKAWTLASSDGYVYAFNLYIGKSNKDKTSESSLGLRYVRNFTWPLWTLLFIECIFCVLLLFLCFHNASFSLFVCSNLPTCVDCCLPNGQGALLE